MWCSAYCSKKISIVIFDASIIKHRVEEENAGKGGIITMTYVMSSQQNMEVKVHTTQSIIYA